MPINVAQFKDIICSASEAEIRADVTLGGALVLHQDRDLVISYAPIDHVQPGAKIVIVGITPGAQQAQNAMLEYRRRTLAGEDQESALAGAKVFASFSGPMRRNLVEMLDYVGLAEWLGVGSTNELWADKRELAHFTSVLRYPVFFRGKNYSGQVPMLSSHHLLNMLDTYLREEAEMPRDAVWVPLGDKAASGLHDLAAKGVLDPARVLADLPHPSGANSERIAYFTRRKERHLLSKATNPAILDAARTRICELVGRLPSLWVSTD